MKLQNIIGKASGRKLRLNPEVSYLEYLCKLSDLGKEQVDGQDRLHCDVAYPSFKVFVYVTDTDASNGAFIYAPGSHKFSLKRLWIEYKMSIKYYVKHFKGDIKPEVLSEDDLKTLNIDEKSMEGKSGSVIIFNTMGFHRRGNFTNSQKPIRQVALVNYRYLDSWANVIGWEA
ncbi:MAG: phytanoyl-CoA dioxygenase family protein [Bacteriovoracaceae bacterium]|nr:phytanoyl-CoA dioxygenase family protein [Bacteriovoracaceae bacterium]